MVANWPDLNFFGNQMVLPAFSRLGNRGRRSILATAGGKAFRISAFSRAINARSRSVSPTGMPASGVPRLPVRANHLSADLLAAPLDSAPMFY